MYFEYNDWLLGTCLTKVPFWKGICILLFNFNNDVTFVPWWKVKKERQFK